MRDVPLHQAERDVRALVFSKDRPLQLEACLRSLAIHAAERLDVSVIWKATTDRCLDAYGTLINEGRDPRAGLVTFCRERDFESDIRRLLVDGERVLFVVDDTIFVDRFSPAKIAGALAAHQEAIGFSLRLGRNTTYCYPVAREQALPHFVPMSGARGWHWPGADGDFGYPLEVSSSVYRTADILYALAGTHFRNPNELEAHLARVAPAFATSRPWLMAYETSIAFSNPCNRVQSAFANRAGAAPRLTADALLEAWEQGYRIDVEALAGYVPRGAHEEAPLRLVKR